MERLVAKIMHKECDYNNSMWLGTLLKSQLRAFLVMFVSKGTQQNQIVRPWVPTFILRRGFAYLIPFHQCVGQTCAAQEISVQDSV